MKSRRPKTTMNPLQPPPSSSSATIEEEQNFLVSQIGDDILECIFSKLPAKSFAYAACVTRLWNSVCGRILSRPKLSSALSRNSSFNVAVNEVVDKVLSEPVRPNFAILYVNNGLNLEEAHGLLCKKLGRIPIIACDASGLIGKEVLTGEIKEVLADYPDTDDALFEQQNGGLMLTIGYLPGMKVKLVNLMRDKTGFLVDRFALDIREFSAYVSGSASPQAIIIFGSPKCDMKSALFTLDHAFTRETIIVGNESAPCVSRLSNTYASALVFARDKCKPDGLGDIQFHYALSPGMVNLAQTYKAVSVKTRNIEHSTWLTSKIEGTDVILDGHQILDGIPQMGSDLYIGVRKRRRCYMIESGKVNSVTFTEFHPILSGDDEYLYVNGVGIKTGDLFHICAPSVDKALASCASVSQNFQKLAEKMESDNSKEEVFGALIFTCCGRGDSFFGQHNVECSPVLDKFPGVPVAGMFCGGEIGRGPSEDQSTTYSCLHVYSTVCMLLSYKP
ncbi:hypothetical protein V2J09_006159 [Rumex salicifolius]